jgi:hypothetical protein
MIHVIAIISFENIADDGESAEIPDGYRDLNWKNFRAGDGAFYPNSG